MPLSNPDVKSALSNPGGGQIGQQQQKLKSDYGQWFQSQTSQGKSPYQTMMGPTEQWMNNWKQNNPLQLQQPPTSGGQPGGQQGGGWTPPVPSPQQGQQRPQGSQPSPLMQGTGGGVSISGGQVGGGQQPGQWGTGPVGPHIQQLLQQSPQTIASILQQHGVDANMLSMLSRVFQQ
jgi:hypothetical protein